MEQLRTKVAIFAALVIVALVVIFLARKRTSSERTQDSKEPASTKSVGVPQVRESTVAIPIAPLPLNFDASLSTEAEKQAFLDETKKRPATELLLSWKEQLAKTNYTQLDFLEIALANKIKDSPDGDEGKEIYRFAADAVINGELDQKGMIRLVKWLGQGGGALVVELMLHWFDGTGDKELRREILVQLTSTSSRAAYGQNAAPVSRILEGRWHNAELPRDFDSGLLPILSQALAKAGDERGIQTLLQEVERGGQTRQAFESESDAKARLALLAMSQIRSEASVELLAQKMQQGSPDTVSFLAAGEALASISKPASTKVLVDWARRADDSSAPLAEAWVSRLRDYDSRKMVRYLFIEGVSFRSEQVKQAVAAAVKSYD